MLNQPNIELIITTTASPSCSDAKSDGLPTSSPTMVVIDCDVSPRPPGGCDSELPDADGPGASPASGIVDDIYHIEIDEEASGSDCSASRTSENKSPESR